MSFGEFLAGLFSVGISLMAGKRLIDGLSSGEIVFFGKVKDWGPFSRTKQPIRFWLSTAWAAFFSLSLGFWLAAMMRGGFE